MSDDVQDWRAVLDGRREWAVVLGDNATIRDDVPRSAAVVSDPPYGGGFNMDYTRFTGGLAPNHGWIPAMIGDDVPFDPSPFLTFSTVVLWGYQFFAPRLPLGSILVWNKKRDSQLGTFLSDAELAWCKGGQGAYVYRETWHGFDRPNERGAVHHPTQKPIGLMRWCLTRARVPADAVVFDPYAGSGTTGVACIQTGRRFIGVEIDPTYHAIAVDRLTKAAAARQPMLAGFEAHA